MKRVPPASYFIFAALIVLALAYLPLMRVLVGIDEQFRISFFSLTVILIAGIMLALSGMILMLRKSPKIEHKDSAEFSDKKVLVLLHASNLLLFTAIPLANFLVCWYLWSRYRASSDRIDQQGYEILRFQVSFYLYLLLSLFLHFVAIGILTTAMILISYLLISCVAVIMATLGRSFAYPFTLKVGNQSRKD